MVFLNQKCLSGTKFIIYIEGSVLYMNTSFVSFTSSIPNFLIIVLDSASNTYSLYNSLFITYYIFPSLSPSKYSFFKNKYHYYFSLFSYLISSSLYGASARFRLIGRGYKAFPLINTYMYKLGYSHSIYYTFPITSRIKKKTKRTMFHQFVGIWSHKTHLYLGEIKSFRIPDVYCAKGIFERGQYFEKKEGKKAFTL